MVQGRAFPRGLLPICSDECILKPDSLHIRNPAENLDANEKIEIVRYVVALEEIVSRADQVEAGLETVQTMW